MCIIYLLLMVGLLCFLEFGGGVQQVCEATTEADRDSWVSAIRICSIKHLRAKVGL